MGNSFFDKYLLQVVLQRLSNVGHRDFLILWLNQWWLIVTANRKEVAAGVVIVTGGRKVTGKRAVIGTGSGTGTKIALGTWAEAKTGRETGAWAKLRGKLEMYYVISKSMNCNSN